MKKAFTLIELFVVVAIASILVAILYPIYVRVKGPSATIDQGIEDLRSNLYSDCQVVGKNMQPTDSDGDGYITGNIKLENPKGEQQIITIRCRAYGDGSCTVL